MCKRHQNVVCVPRCNNKKVCLFLSFVTIILFVYREKHSVDQRKSSIKILFFLICELSGDISVNKQYYCIIQSIREKTIYFVLILRKESFKTACVPKRIKLYSSLTSRILNFCLSFATIIIIICHLKIKQNSKNNYFLAKEIFLHQFQKLYFFR